jgi:spore coat polysaccharide biosynthesis predicted glycosyltransferase SpsG
MIPPSHSSPAPLVLIRCDGSAEIGLGHIVRCLALADELSEWHGAQVRFLIQRGDVAVQMAQRSGYDVLQPGGGTKDDRAWISRVLEETQPDALVLDFRNGLSPEAVRDWRKQGVVMATIDDPEDKRLACDLFFSPPVPQVSRMSWEGFSGTKHVGWEWVLLRKQFANNGTARPSNARPVVLVTMGGSDPAGLTLKAVKALDSLDEEFEAVVILGSAFCHDEVLKTILSSARRKFEIRRNVPDMAAAMVGADLAVASFAVTAYELASQGVPGIYLCLSDDHAESASAFVDAGIGLSLGKHDGVSESHLSAVIQELLQAPERRRQMSHRARKLADGLGAARIACAIVQNLKIKHLQSQPMEGKP